ncbi:MAG: M55 family metallopeptidase [Clostridia bacterium]|nr:M55 family metallopeptidase [Clostridia bacterium]
MTVFIETDLEGISGVSTIDMVANSDPRALERLMADTNAAVRGAYAGGADRVLVLDGHGGGRNFLPSLLDPRAVQVRDVALDGVDAVFLVGAHAMAGTQNAFLDHTQSSVSWHNYTINGRRYGESGQLAAFAGSRSIPFVMASGDFAACAECLSLFGRMETAPVKTADGRNRAHCLPDGEAEDLIFEAARRAIALIPEKRPFRVILPAEIAVEFNRTDYADAAMDRHPDAERLDPRTVRRVIREIREYGDLLI